MSNAEDFRLIETMRVSEDGEVFLLQRHLDRLRNSARHFSFKYDSKALRAAIRCDGLSAIETILPEAPICSIKLRTNGVIVSRPPAVRR